MAQLRHSRLTERAHYRETLAAGTSRVVFFTHHRAVAVAVDPASPGTATVEYTFSDFNPTTGEPAVWFTLDTAEPQELRGATALRVSAGGGAVTFEAIDA